MPIEKPELEVLDLDIVEDDIMFFCVEKRESSDKKRLVTHYQLPHPIPENTESYSDVGENKFIAVSMEPLSTFSVDVDNASYINIRRYIK